MSDTQKIFKIQGIDIIELNENNGIKISGDTIQKTTDGGNNWSDFSVEEEYNAGKKKGNGEVFNDYTNNTASGNYSHAEGNDTLAEGVASHTGGIGTIARNVAETVVGKYNVDEHTNKLFVVGNGTADNSRSDAFVVKDTGQTIINNNSSADDINFLIQYNGNNKVLINNNGTITTKGNLYIGTSSEVSIMNTGEINGKNINASGNILGNSLDIKNNNITNASISNTGNISGASLTTTGNITASDNITSIYNTNQKGIRLNSNTQKIEISNNTSASQPVWTDYGETQEVFNAGKQNTTTHGEVFNDYTNNTASGDYSHAEGNWTNATGSASHAEGNGTMANGVYSHAEGVGTEASGNNSHAEGNGTIASGENSHAEGYNNTTDNIITRDRVNYNIGASGNYCHSEGLNTVAGYVNSTTTRNGCHAEGQKTIANGENSHAEGFDSLASGEYSHAEGEGTTASNICSHAEGGGTKASGEYSHAEGIRTIASGNYSHAEGEDTEASGNHSHAEGYDTTASGASSHTEGTGTTASNMCSHAEGEYTTASADVSHAEGSRTEASGDCSHAEGFHTTASGSHSHAEGEYSIASGNDSHAEGELSTASGNHSHAEGYNTTASGNCSYAGGYNCTTAGENSFVFGKNCSIQSNGSNSYCFGEGLILQNNCGSGRNQQTTNQFVIGKYNVAHGGSGYDDDIAFMVGNGTSTTKHNCFVIRYNGDVFMFGKSRTNTSTYMTETIIHTVPTDDDFEIGQPAYMNSKIYYTYREAEEQLNISEKINMAVDEINDNIYDKKYAENCICGVKKNGNYNEFIGIITNVSIYDEETNKYLIIDKDGYNFVISNKIVAFATHGDYLFKVPESNNINNIRIDIENNKIYASTVLGNEKEYEIGDEILYDGRIFIKPDENEITENNYLTYIKYNTAAEKYRIMSIGKITKIINTNYIAVFKN